jgi:UDP-glucose 4-epimerase
MTKKKTVVITGATGFIGQHICARLVELQHTVVAVQRKPEPPVPGTHPVIAGDLAGTTDWPGILNGADCVVHLAASAHRGNSLQIRDRERIFQVNVEATRRLGEAAAAAGVKRFIFLSSIAVNGSHTSGRGPFAVDDAPDPQTVYGQSKHQAELALKDVQKDAPGLAVDVIRCPAVIGRNAPGNLAVLNRLAVRRVPLPFASIVNRRAFIAVDDLTSFISVRLNTDGQGMSTFLVATPDRISTPDLIRAIAKAKRTTAMLFPFPPSLLRRLLHGANMQDKADALTGNLEIDISSALATGWRPALSIEAAIAGVYS